MSDTVDATLARWRGEIDSELERLASERAAGGDRLGEAVRYSLTGGGKRVRGLLLMGAYRAVGGRSRASGLAAAVEIVHAYSLVHDDLPCMDNDSIRRGRATTHRAYDVPTATLAGVIMVPLAVEQVLRSSRALALDDGVSTRIVEVLMCASGAGGMIGGQLLDLEGERQTLDIPELEAIHGAKTGALISAAMTIGGLAAGAGEEALHALSAAGAGLGLAFQIADDVLDATGSSETQGKTAGHDAALAKSTYASALGVSAARGRGEDLVAQAMSRLEQAGLETPTLRRLAHFVSARRS